MNPQGNNKAELLERLRGSPNAPSVPNVSPSSSSGIDLSLNLGLLQQSAITSAATVNPITNVQEVVQVHRDNNPVRLPTKRYYPDNVSGEFHAGESSNMGEEAARAKRPATESDDSTYNNVENPSIAAPVTPQMYQFFSETPRSEPIRHDNDGAFVLAQRSQTSEPVQPLSGYVEGNDRARNARALLFQRLSEQAGSLSRRPSQGSQGINYFVAASSSRTHNYHNQVQISRSGNTPFISYEPSLPIPQTPSAEGRRVLPYEIRYILESLRRGQPLIFMTRNHNQVDAVPPNRGLSVEMIMEHMETKTFASVFDKEDPEAEGEKCPICLEEFADSDEIGKLHLCVHKYHVDCIKQWLVESNVCPVCKRKALNTNNGQNEAGSSAGAEASEVDNSDSEDDNA